MKKISVKEYTKITYSKSINNPEKYFVIDKDFFDDFHNFITGFNNLGTNNEPLDIVKVKYEKNIGTVMIPQNYVGVIETKKRNQIEILPKVYTNSGQKEEEKITKKVFIKMLESMKNLISKNFSGTSLDIDKLSIYEIYIRIYINEVDLLVKKGLKSNYVFCSENIHKIKGKLNIKKHITKNIAHKEKFYCNFCDFKLNRPENRIIKSTLLKIYFKSENSTNKKRLSQLLNFFEFVNPSIDYEKDFSLISQTRELKEYDLILKWSKAFLKNQSFTTFSGNFKTISLLFPMEKLFEEYIAFHIKKIINNDKKMKNWKILSQDRSYELFEEPKKFHLKPDIVITRDDNSKIIIDTKWKNLINNPDKNYNISQQDMYQMYAYSQKYDALEIWLLYPLNAEFVKNNIEEKNNEIYFISKNSSGKPETIIRIFFVDLVNIDQSLEKLKKNFLNPFYIAVDICEKVLFQNLKNIKIKSTKNSAIKLTYDFIINNLWKSNIEAKEELEQEIIKLWNTIKEKYKNYENNFYNDLNEFENKIKNLYNQYKQK